MANRHVNDDKETPLVLNIPIAHRRQRYQWDCGVTCVLMILSSECRDHFVKNFNLICKEEGFGKSTWTIDLCYLLKRYGVTFTFCTVTMGVNPDFYSQTFYEKILQKDTKRIQKRFSEANEKGISICETSLSCQDFVNHIARKGPIILLTNAGLLTCDTCKHNKFSVEFCACCWGNSYFGHYIVLSGYDLAQEVFFYHNPTFRDRTCSISFSSLNKARLSYGTDEDCILIKRSRTTV